MSKSVEEVSKLTESTYKVGTSENTTGAEMVNWLHSAQIPVSPTGPVQLCLRLYPAEQTPTGVAH